MPAANERAKSAERTQRELVWVMPAANERVKSAERTQREAVWVMQAGDERWSENPASLRFSATKAVGLIESIMSVQP
jgi:hypothetical protein